MRARRAVAAAVVGVLALWLAPSASAANELLETVTVDAAATTVTRGAVQLNKGTKYELHVSGTFTLANGYGQSYDEDALYCYGDSGFDTPQCTPTPQRFGDFFIGSGSSSLQNIDAYQAPGGGGTPLGYSISHTYIVDFYPPADGPLTAGGYLAKYGCNGCTTSISGTITIEIYGPSAPPPSPPPPPSGASFTFPTVFCAGTASDLTGQTAPLARRLCATRKLVTFQEHEQAQRDLRQLVYVAAYSCGYALSGRTGSDEAFITAFAICNLAIQEIVWGPDRAGAGVSRLRGAAGDPGKRAVPGEPKRFAMRGVERRPEQLPESRELRCQRQRRLRGRSQYGQPGGAGKLALAGLLPSVPREGLRGGARCRSRR